MDQFSNFDREKYFFKHLNAEIKFDTMKECLKKIPEP